MRFEVMLYGPLARYGGSDGNIYVRLEPEFPEGATMQMLLESLGLPAEERGITFINGNLSAMPGLQPDLDQVLFDGDRVALFHTKSMWPFQYRHEAAMAPGMRAAMSEREDGGLRSRFD